jgi:hypothetical protein
MVEPARGDQRPCSCPGCTGTMRYGRESDNATAPARTVLVSSAVQDAKGWICNRDAGHFSTRPSSSSPARLAPR